MNARRTRRTPDGDAPERAGEDADTSQWVTRRSVLAAGLTATLGGLAGCNGTGSTRHGWIDVETPTEKGLSDAAMTVDGPYAVGESGLVLTRRGDQWRIVVENGPNGSDNALNGADVTGDGRKLWVGGASGSLGRYDVVDDEMEDLTAPREKTSGWTDVAVSGRAGHERVFLVDSSGELLPGRWTNGAVSWSETVKPTGGESAAAVDVASDTPFVADTAGGVYQRNGEDRWSTVGIRGVDTALHDLAAVDGDLVNAAADDGSIYVYNGYNWLQLRASEQPLRAVDRDRGRGVAAGADGVVYAIEGNNWSGESTPTSKTLEGCALGNASYTDVVVGSDGLVLERFG